MAEIIGTDGDDVLMGTSGNDVIDARGGRNLVYAGDGDDAVLVRAFGDVLDGGLGNDTLILTDRLAGWGVSLDGGMAYPLGMPHLHFGTDNITVTNFENVTGSSGSDLIWGDAGANILRGMDGFDEIRGGAGNDVIEGGADLDRLFGEDGDDTFIGVDNIDGGAGFDTVNINGRMLSTRIISENGVTILDDGTTRYTLTGVERLVFSDGVVNALPDGRFAPTPVISGTDGNDFLYGLAGPDHLSGGAGNDRLYGNIGSDLLDGGQGLDVALYDGVRRQYDAFSARVAGGPEGGSDRLISIEAVQFVDGVLTFDPDSLAAKVMRLYDAALDRAPDQQGFEDLLDYLETGASFESLAAAFIDSPEFVARYGALTNEQFVDKMYRFSLDRAPDSEGFQFWVGRLNAGMTRQDLLIAFSECPEHRGLTQPRLDEGLWVADDTALRVARLYDAAFDRLPDLHGLSSWTTWLKDGKATFVELASLFTTSPEFSNRHGALSDQQFVELMYRSALDREGEALGVAHWVALMNDGMSRGEVLAHFSDSAEHVALTRSFWLGGIRTEGMSTAAEPVAAETSPTMDRDFDAFVLPTGSSDVFQNLASPHDDDASSWIASHVRDHVFRDFAADTAPPALHPEPAYLQDEMRHHDWLV